MNINSESRQKHSEEYKPAIGINATGSWTHAASSIKIRLK